MRRHTFLPACAAVAVLTFAGCSGGADAEGRRRLFTRGGEEAAADHASGTEVERPEVALGLGADDVVARIGSVDLRVGVDWTVSRPGDDARRVHVAERHRVRQLATGEFEVSSEIDPGRGPGGLSGKRVIFAGGEVYARGAFAPFRERPTDRGRDARRFRDESFGLAAEVARLAGAALDLERTGDAALLGRRAVRYALSLDPGRFAPPTPARPAAAGAPDLDTSRRLAFLDGHQPSALDGEVLLDAETGVPLRVKMNATFTVRDRPGVKVVLRLVSQLTAVGGSVGEVKPPPAPLPDERKPRGVAAALEAASLKTRAAEAEKKAGEKTEPEDEE
jgi:hypothetical protein